MPATIGAAADVAVVRMPFEGGFGEDITKIVSIDGAALDAAIEQFLDDIDAATAAIFTATVTGVRVVTGLNDTISVPQEQAMVNNQLVLAFTRVHPLNALKTISRSFLLPAPVVAARNLDGTPNVAATVGDRSSADENLRGIIDFLEDNMTYEDVAGTIYVGGWTYSPADSGYIAAPAVLDGN